VGHSSSGNVLIASNGATVSAGNGFIGFNSTASSNSATVTGPGTSWLVASNLYVGSNAAFNRLIVSNGGFVKNLSGFIGYASSSSNNLAVVTGSGSMWSNAIDLIIGRDGPGNQLVISNGATVQSVRAYLGLNVLCNNNLAVVTGAGSVCKGSSLFLGGGGSSNRLVVSDGGVVQDSAGSIGSDPSANYNVAVVTGSGSTWSNSSVLSVGDFGDGNQLVVSNGGAVFARSSVVLGSNPSSLSNRIEVNGGSLLASNASATALFDIRRGTNVFNAGLIDVDRLVLTNALGKFEFNGGTLVTRGAFINNNAAFNVGNSGGTPAVWDVRAGVSNHFVADYLVVGERASFNQLLVTNGAFLTNGIDAVIGDSFGANSNSAVISGAGSRWAANGNLDIGYFGSFNRLVISNGGVVANATGELGNASTSSNNFALVTGAGSLWTNRQELRVGVGGGGNQLVVSNGGTVFTMATRSLGFISGANSNTVTVTDAGSRWLGDGTLYVGSDSAFNRLTVANGGLVTSGLGVFGRVSSSSNNVALVTGSGSLWTNSGELYVGDFGSGNLLVVSNGGTVFAMFNRYIGNNTGANSNTVIVTGADSRWLRDDSLFLGNGGAFNRLVVSDGAQVLSGTAGLGFFSGGNSNQVVVTGAGSLWSNRFDLFVGDGGSANLLVVSNGARVVNSNGFVAAGVSGALGSNNTALVTGAGSIWSNRASLTVGVSGSGNRLTVSNGAMVSVGVGAFLGVNSTSTGNRLVVDGSTLLVTNVAGTGLLDIRRGTNVLNSGLIEADILRMTNVGGFFQFNGGTLSARNSRVSNGNFLLIGNGTSPATFILAGNGLHEFTGILFATVSSNATFTGNGTIGGAVPLQLSAGSRLVPGTSVGKMIFSNSPALQGATIMEISKNGAALTNDQIQVTAPLTYGGSLTVSNLGPTALAIGDRFPLFSASSYAGAFTNITLPPLAFGLAFTNKLGVDGSLEVFSSAPPSPTLTIQRSNDVLFVSWPTSASNFCLETTFDLSSPVVWKTVTSGIITNGSSFVFSLANLSALPKQFFRLAFPCSTALTPVSLSIQLSNNLVTLSWPSNAFRLETTFSVAPPVSWQTISNGINNSGPLRAFTFTNNPAVTNQFFRLAFP